jgi:methionyl-tRNA formyltransferase
MSHLRIAFFGTPEFSVDILTELSTSGFMPSVIVTAPDAPRGRGLILTPPPVKVWAETHDIPVLQPHTLRLNNTPDTDRDILYNSEWDLFIVASYGKILPQELLDIPQKGTLNVHPSLLPQYRGASPIRSAILDDNNEAVGVSIMLLDAGMDTGPIVAQGRVTLEKEDGDWPPRATVLEKLLAHEGGKLLAEIIPEWIQGTVVPEPQNESEATISKKITKDMGLIDLTLDPWKNFLKIQALEGWPGTYFFIEKNGAPMRIKIIDAVYKDNELHLLSVIPEGKKEMTYEVFAQTYLPQ